MLSPWKQDLGVESLQSTALPPPHSLMHQLLHTTALVQPNYGEMMDLSRDVVMLPTCPKLNSTGQCSQLPGLLNCMISSPPDVKKASNIDFPCDRDILEGLSSIEFRHLRMFRRMRLSAHINQTEVSHNNRHFGFHFSSMYFIKPINLHSRFWPMAQCPAY